MPNLMPSELIALLADIEKHAADIYIRDYNAEGKVENMALADMPGRLALRHALHFLIRGEMPRVVVRHPKGGS
jgi:hypothetical protein